MSRTFIFSYPSLFNFLISKYLNHFELGFIFVLNFGIIYIYIYKLVENVRSDKGRKV